jgi:hypothetical protein
VYIDYARRSWVARQRRTPAHAAHTGSLIEAAEILRENLPRLKTMPVDPEKKASFYLPLP